MEFFDKEIDGDVLFDLTGLPKEHISDSIVGRHSKVKSCGPYVLKESTLNDITLISNPFYSKSPNPKKIDRVIIKIVKDETTRFSKLRKGELDIVQNGINIEKIKNIKQYPELKIAQGRINRVVYINNIRKELTSLAIKTGPPQDLKAEQQEVNKEFLRSLEGREIIGSIMAADESPQAVEAYLKTNGFSVAFVNKVEEGVWNAKMKQTSKEGVELYPNIWFDTSNTPIVAIGPQTPNVRGIMNKVLTESKKNVIPGTLAFL